MESNKTRPTDESVGLFVESIENERRRIDSRTLVSLLIDATGQQPAMWGPSIVGFGSEHYKYESGREGDMPIVSFSPRVAALTIYSIIPDEHGRGLLEQLGPHTTSKGCLYIKDLTAIDTEVLRELIIRAYRAKTT